MNKIEKLLKELCPNGVEYKKLNEVCDIVKGKQLNKDKLFKEGPYAVINGGINPSGYWEEYNFNEDTITISQGGASAGYVQWQENKFWAGAHCYVLINPNSKLIYRFIYHVVKMNENKYMESQLGAGIPSLSSKDLGNTEIPIPPLEIQKEIVNVLDKMVFLERELERELEKRKTQYSYYRDKLLKPEVDVQIVKLKDIATLFFRGNGIKREHVKECGIPCVRYGEIYTKYNIWFDKCISHTDLSLIDNPKYIEYGDVLFAITGESVIDIGKTVAYIGNEKCLVGGDILVMRHKQNPKYLSYALSTTNAIEQKGKGKIKSKVVHTNADSIGNIEIPLPSLEIQQKIVDVLDNFEKYCSDLNIGLPAEIEARRKQYEYYRNKLLSFNLDVSDVPETLAGGVMRMLNYVFGKSEISIERLFNIKNGYTPSKANSEYWTKGNIPWFRMEDLRENGTVLYDAKQHVNQKAIKGELFKKDSIIVATSATIGEHALIKTDFMCNQRFTCLTVKDRFMEFADPKFLYYYMFIVDEWCKKNTTKSSFASVNMEDFRKYKISIPSLDVQRRTVEILDVFDAYVNDLTDGLPAEIDGRRKQYEFYRNKLLTFNRLGGE